MDLKTIHPNLLSAATKGVVSDKVSLYLGDFNDIAAKIEDESVDAILTDPPYNNKAIRLYWQVWDIAGRILRPGGYLVMIMPHHILDPFKREKVIEYKPDYMTEERIQNNPLRFRWTVGMLQLNGAHPRLCNREHNIRVTWKPVGWWIKQKTEIADYSEVVDSFHSTQPDKSKHRWEQSVEWARFCCDMIPDNSTIFEPMSGTGTLPRVATEEFNHKVIACDIDPNAYDLTVSKLGLENENATS